ncbi:hypothetical protein GCM10017771_82010 [Streptomyces capitiformicae]|uniref:Uncharacterized protein n=1 Tax=Streptomyces capitiformicae TaxID=2014920 RepID=A0A918ZME7_9ACTN|nr:hypothetical protein GCM10017771_82010 [Streptomyces capitiformicae]
MYVVLARISSRTTVISRRASGAPMHLWTPCPKAEVAVRTPVEVELVGVLEDLGVTVGGGEVQPDGAGPRNGAAVQFHVGGGQPAEFVQGQVEPERLLHGTRDQIGPRPQCLLQSGNGGHPEDRRPECLRDGEEPGGDHLDPDLGDLSVGEGGAVDLGGEGTADHVLVGDRAVRCGAAPRQRRYVARRRRTRPRLASRLVGQVEQRRQGLRRQRPAVRRDHVGLPGGEQRLDVLDGVAPDERLQRGMRFGRT